uniref:Outer membrane protein porin n=1 Tax=Tanacetum cinerariifolium TaxID=118510 RepID=A0A6L2N4S6_TANCI|nr:outer membrane protein porin [Tanacetum cinerariifolium]
MRVLRLVQSEEGTLKHLKSKVVDFTTVQNLQVQGEKLKSVNESLKFSVEELSKAHALVEATLRERDELISAQCKKIRLLKEQSETFYEILDQEIKQQIILFEEDKRMFLAKIEFLEKVSSSVQKEYNGLLASNDVLKQILETKFKFLKHDDYLEKMFEMIEQEYKSNVSNISITSSTIETKNLEPVKEMGDKMKCFDEEKKVFETKISKLEKDLAQRVKDFDGVETELSRRTDKFETYFANIEKDNALLKSQLTSQNNTSLQKENNDLRTSYNVLKEKYETDCEKLEKRRMI